MKTRVMRCRNCHKDTVHEMVDRKSALSDENGFVRGMLAVCSLGLSEAVNTATVTRYWQCRRCDEIRKD